MYMPLIALVKLMNIYAPITQLLSLVMQLCNETHQEIRFVAMAVRREYDENG